MATEHDPKLVEDLGKVIHEDHWWDCDHYGGDDCAEDRARAVLDKLTARGRLLPSGGEVSEEYSVVFEDGYRAKTFDERLAQIWRADPQAAIVGPVQRRTVNTWPDGLVLLGPWSPVLSDNSEVPND